MSTDQKLYDLVPDCDVPTTTSEPLGSSAGSIDAHRHWDCMVIRVNLALCEDEMSTRKLERLLLTLIILVILHDQLSGLCNAVQGQEETVCSLSCFHLFPSPFFIGNALYQWRNVGVECLYKYHDDLIGCMLVCSDSF